MPATLNLSDEALHAVRRLARQRGRTLGAVASELILQAVRTDSRSVVRNGVPTFAAPPSPPTGAEGPVSISSTGFVIEPVDNRAEVDLVPARQRG